MKPEHDRYAIHWVSKFNDSWYVSLKLHQRGLYDQMIDWAKKEGDTGYITGKSWAFFGAAWGCDGKTCGKILGKFLRDGKIEITEGDGYIMIHVRNYKKNQHVKRIDGKIKRGKVQENSPPIEQNRIEQNRITQNDRKKEPDKSTPALQDKKEGEVGTESELSAHDQFHKWGEDPKNLKAVQDLCGTIHYDLIAGDQGNHRGFLLRHVVEGEFSAYLTANSDKALESLKKYHGGSWLRMLKSWLDRMLEDIRSGKRKRPSKLGPGMSAADEKARDDAHRSRSGGGMQTMKQIVGGGE